MEILTSYVGAISSLVTAVVLTILTHILDFGKVHIYTDRLIVQYNKVNEKCEFVKCDISDNPSHFSIRYVFSVHNRSGKMKIMRNLSLGFYNKKGEKIVERGIFKEDEKFVNLEINRDMSKSFSINIKPKEVVTETHITFILPEDFSNIKKSNQIKLIYMDDKNNIKNKEIFKLDEIDLNIS